MTVVRYSFGDHARFTRIAEKLNRMSGCSRCFVFTVLTFCFLVQFKLLFQLISETADLTACIGSCVKHRSYQLAYASTSKLNHNHFQIRRVQQRAHLYAGPPREILPRRTKTDTGSPHFLGHSAKLVSIAIRISCHAKIYKQEIGLHRQF